MHKFNKILTLLFASTFVFSCAQNKKDLASAVNPIINQDSILVEELDSSLVVQESKPIIIDTLNTDIALFLGALKSDTDKFKIEEKIWNKLKKETDKNFNVTLEDRLLKMENWHFNKFIDSSKDTLPVFYPFSGPDFLHVNYLYPNTDTYILTAIEKIGSLPDFSKKSAAFLEEYLSDIDYFMRDIYLRGYFITSHMKDDLKDSRVNGLIGPLFWFIARTDHDIVSLEYVTIDNLGNIIPENNPSEGWLADEYDGIKFVLKDETQKIKNLIYLSADISDKGLNEKNPNLKTYLEKFGDVNTFVKSASYLMHYRSFKQIRSIVLDKSYSIFQDDTGIPYRFFDTKTYNVNLFGKYIDPIKDFESTMKIITQEDLREAYQDKNLNKGYLPFSLGYHWRKSKNQNQQFVVRKY